MNYRHAFHAGNHADVFKHAVLTLLLDWLLAKPAPFAVIDTHAGIGLYDLKSEAALKTNEANAGVGRIFGAGLASAPRYLELLRELNPAGLSTYPGSPEIVRRMMSGGDRLIACELHPADAKTLKARYRNDRRVAVHHRDGYEAIRAFVPPPERRGMVLIDPPFEVTDEVQRTVKALQNGLGKWPTGTFVAWYPIKDSRIADALADAAVSTPFPKTLRAEFVPYARDGVIMAGAGLLICNAPWRFEEKLTALCEELTPLLGDGAAQWSVDWLTQ